MDTSTTIKDRRSIQQYKKQIPEREKITKIIQAATWAPSAGNEQPWKFIIVTDETKRKKIAALCEQEWMSQAPVHIVVCGQTKTLVEHYGEKGYMYNIQSCAAAIQNLLLEAHNLGLATCWVGHMDEAAINSELEIKDAHLQAIITVGITAQTKEGSRKPLYTTIYFEKWGNTERKTDIFPLEETLKRLKK